MKNQECKSPIRSMRIRDELWLPFKAKYGVSNLSKRIKELIAEDLAE